MSKVIADPSVVVPAKRRRRRPSGEPPPLPRSLRSSGKILLALLGSIFLVLVAVAFLNLGESIDRFDSRVIKAIQTVQNGVLTTITRGIDEVLSSRLVLGALRWATILALLVFKRIRHLIVYLGSLFATGWIATNIALLFVRARPLEVDILGEWQGASIPSRPIAALGATLFGIVYSMIPAGRGRGWAKTIVWAALGLLAAARLYLGVDHLTDVIFGLIFGISIPVIAFRMFAPNESFPVRYKGGRAAHLDISGKRGEAIKVALQHQLGLQVLDMKLFGLGGSAGSTPMRLTIEGNPPVQVFAKLYAQTHLRADRWYKLGRTLLYGRLEDEGTFSTVRRLVQYEDYLLRVMRDAGLSTPVPYGFVEITPEREYLIVMSFVEGTTEILDAEVNEGIIDSALASVRALWDAGLAHRDVKPSNILVRGNDVFLIDVAFGEVRPTPWRQAVDLGNMMIVLGLKDDPDRVYERALRFFTPDEIAEAFAATHGVTLPSQSRSLLRADRSRVVKRFRELAPPHRPIPIQSWSWRRIGLIVGILVALLWGLGIGLVNLEGGGLVPVTPGSRASYATVVRAPHCTSQNGEGVVLEAQAVPSATQLFCLDSLPLGWRFRSMDVRSGSVSLFMESDRLRPGSLDVSLTAQCDVGDATKVPTDEPGTERYESIDTLGTGYSGTRYYVFPGGCATYEFDFIGRGRTALAHEASLAIGFVSRDYVERRMLEETGLKL